MDTLLNVLLAHPGGCRLALLAAVVVSGALAACLSDDALRASVLEALKRAGWPIQAAAAQIGISRQRLGHQLDGTDPLTCLSRLLTRCEGFAAAFAELSAAGQGFVVVSSVELVELLNHLRAGQSMAKAGMRETA